MLKNLGKTCQSCLFHIVKKKLNALNMSSTYAFLSVLLRLLNSLNSDQHINAYTLLHLFLEVIAMLFWWPLKETDGVPAMNYVHVRPQE